MARSILDIVIRMSKQGGADRETVKALVQVKSSLTQVMGVAGAVTGALYTAKKAFDFTKEGAQLQFVEDRFNRLGASIGANTGLLDNLRETTQGLYSDTELMASANDLMGLGLAKNSDQLERMMLVSSGLNMNMNQLVLTLTNMTTMRFDALSVSVDGFEEKVKSLEAAGMDANDAFKEAFLQQAEAQLEKVGNAADSALGPVMRMESEWKNMVDELKKDFASSVIPALEAMNRGTDESAKRTEAYSAAVQETAASLRTQGKSEQDIAKYIRTHQQEINALAASYQGAQTVQETYTEGVQELQQATESWTMSLDTVQASISGPIAQAQADYQDKLRDLQAELVDLQAEESKWFSPPKGSKKYDELQEKIAGVKQEIEDTTAAYDEQARQIIFNIAQQEILASSMSTAEQSEAIARLGQSMGFWDEQTANAIETAHTWTTQLADGTVDINQYSDGMEALGRITAQTGKESSNAAAGGIADADEGMKALRQDTFGATQNVDSLRSQMEKANGMVADMTVNISVNGSIPNFGRNSGGITRSGSSRGGLQETAGFASGGQWAPGLAALVGDAPGGKITPYTEMITPTGRILPNKDVRALASMGLLGEVMSMAFAESAFDFSRTPAQVTSPTRRAREKKPVRLKNTSVAAAVSEPTVADTTPLVQVTEKAVASLGNATVQQSVESRQTRAQQAAQNAELAGLLRGIERRLARQERTLPTAIQAAIQQRP